MNKPSSLLFNLGKSNTKLSTNKKLHTQSENKLLATNQPSRKKRTFAEVETGSSMNFNMERSSGNMRLSIPKIASISSEELKNRQPFQVIPQKPVILPTERKSIGDCSDAFTQLDKFLYLDEKFSENDKFSSKNASSNFCQKSKEDYFFTLSRKSYPDLILTKYEEKQKEGIEFNISSGIFEELNLVYIAIDTEIFLWNYFTNDIHTFKEIRSPITCLHLTKPRPGVFSDEISHILVTATVNEIYILLLKVASANKLQLILSDYVLDLNYKYVITTISSSAQRRIFLGSQNNYIFELEYNYSSALSDITAMFTGRNKIRTLELNKEGFFNKLIPSFFSSLKSNCYYSKIAIDDTRNVLYALKHYLKDTGGLFEISNVINSEIEVYDLGVCGKEFKKKGVLLQEDVKKHYHFSTHFKNNNNYIIAEIATLTRKDSKHFHLIAITNSGLRAFIKFDTYEPPNTKPTPLVNNLYIPRPKEEFTITISPIADHSKSMKLDGREAQNLGVRDLTELIEYKTFFFFGRNLFYHMNNSSNNFSSLELIEIDESIPIKAKLDSRLDSLQSNEFVTSLINFRRDIKNVNLIKKIPLTNSKDNLYRLMRLVLDEYNFPSKYISSLNKINYKDSDCHFSSLSMHSYATQQFLEYDQYVILTGLELIILGKIRPIDRLFEILREENLRDQSVLFERFLTEHSLYETSYMLLTIMSNPNMRFFLRIPSRKEEVSDEIQHVYNSAEFIEKSRSLFLDLITSSFQPVTHKDETSSNNFVIGHAVTEKTLIVNHITYSFFMYLARVSRLFWEEVFFNGDQTTFIDEPLKTTEFTILIIKLKDFSDTIKSMQNEILQKANDFYNSRAIADEKTSDEFISFKNDIEQVINLASRLIEVLRFVQSVYSLGNIKKYIKMFDPNTTKVLFEMKYKDLIRHPRDVFIKNWLEEYLELIYSEKDIPQIRLRLKEFHENSPSIITKGDIEAIIASVLLKLSKKVEDEITRKNTLNQAIDLLSQYPESIKVDRIVKLLAEINEVVLIIRICCLKAIFLKKLFEKENYVNFDTLSSISFKGSQFTSAKSNLYQEFKECLYYIFTVITEINTSLKADTKSLNSEDMPVLLKEFIKQKSLSTNQKAELMNQSISEVLRFDDKLIHSMVFEHLNNLGLLENISNFNSPYIEGYLNSLAEIDKYDPKKHESLFKYFFKSNDFENAIKKVISILFLKLALINFKNIDNADGLYVSLQDRKKYCLWGLNCIEAIFTSRELDEVEKAEKVKIKSTLTDLKSILILQISVYEHILVLYEKELDLEKKTKLERELYQLDTQIFSIDDLYNLSKNYCLYNDLIEILFEMSKNEKNFNVVSKEDIQSIFCSYIISIIEQNGKNYPKSIFPTLNMIVAKHSQVKTQGSDKLLPLQEIVKTIEQFNFKYFDFSMLDQACQDNYYSAVSYEADRIPYWLILFIQTKLNYSYSQIFRLYYEIYSQSKDLEDSVNIYFVLMILAIINIWSIEIGLKGNKVEINSNEFSRIERDTDQLIKERGFIMHVLDKMKKDILPKEMKFIVSSSLITKITDVFKYTEEKYHQVYNIFSQKQINESFMFNFRKSTDPNKFTTDSLSSFNNIRRVSIKSPKKLSPVREVYTLDSLFDVNQTFKSLVEAQKASSQNPQPRRIRNIMEEEF